MFPFTQLFWYKLIFTAELLAAETLFTFRLKRRKNFIARLIISIIGVFAVAFFFPLFNINNPFYSIFIFFTIFAVSVGFMKFVFDEPFISLLFCGVASYALQHMAYQCYSLVVYTSNLNGGAVLGLYGEVVEFPLDWETIPLYITVYSFVYWFTTLIFARQVKKYGNLKINSLSLFIIFVLMAMVVIIINMVVIYEAMDDFNLTFITSVSLLAILSCVFVLFLLLTLLSNEKYKTEYEYVNRLWRQEQKQFMASKANVDFINSTYHDLKYQIELLKRDPTQREALLKNIDKAFQAYDTKMVTGNNALDVILTEKAMECNVHGVVMNCMVDGKLFDFIREVDLYTMFGNALDNAMEAVKDLDTERRVISLTTSILGDMFSVSIRNYYNTELEFEDGLPVTTKDDKNRHGYGMASIKKIVESYGGNIQVALRDGVFNLTMLFFKRDSK